MDSPLPTRLLLSNLPPSLTNPLLKQHLNRCPPHAPALTDLKILLKPDGTSRRIAFVGFKDSKEADRVRTWVAGTWVQGAAGGARVKVDWAKDTQDAPRPKKRVKLSPGPSSPPPLVPTSTSLLASTQDHDDRFAEFMAVMAPRRNRALHDPTPQPLTLAPFPPSSSLARSGDGLSESMEPSEALKGTETEARRDGAAQDEALSDMEYMARRMKRSLDTTDDDGPQDALWEQDKQAQAEPDPPASSAADAEATPDATQALILESGRLFLRNLAFSITEEDLRTLLEPFGQLHQIHIPLDANTKTPKGLAYATFASASCAVQAFKALDCRSFQGRLLHILPAVGRKLGDASKDSATNVKNERLETRKQDAAKGISWASLYMNSDAVVSSVADRLNITKADLLDPSSNNAAVRVALAETHVIAETKKYFEAEGVDIKSLTVRGPRSPTTILVKNIPYNTTTATLAALFSPFGPISRLLLPPAGTMAVVEMADPSSAANAWRNLVYKKLGGSVLYLEKAPVGLWNGNAAPSEPQLPIASSSVDDIPSEEGSTLFIKNLSFSTTSDTLKDTFSHLPGFVFARVQTKPDPKVAGRTLSMGFGFVGFRTAAAAVGAKRARDGLLLEGHQLEIRFAQRGKDVSKGTAARSTSATSTSTKLLVKNVPFEVTRKEIRELFSAYGQLKSVRLPRKFDQKTRGFAFLDFASRRDAEAAFAALEHTHLLGRHLVLQWAEEGEADLEQLRSRTGFSESMIGGRTPKFAMGDSVDGRMDEQELVTDL